MRKLGAPLIFVLALLLTLFAPWSAAQASGLSFEGRVQGGGAAIVGARVSLIAAGVGKATPLAAATTDTTGRFWFATVNPPAGAVLYLVASGGRPQAGAGAENPAIRLLAILGATPPGSVVVNELTTVASAWASAQLFSSDGLTGNATGVRIAAGNVPNLVNLSTGGFGGPVQDALNGSQTPTLARFASLGNILSGCVTQVAANACADLFRLATPQGGEAPADTLEAALAIARQPWNRPGEIFGLMDRFYPKPENSPFRPAPFLPYLTYAPSSWALSLRYSGGGLNAPGGIAIDSAGNAWTTNNFMPGAQSSLQSALGGAVSKIAPNGLPLSPMTFGFNGGGLVGGGFGAAIRNDTLWVGNVQSRSVSVVRMSDGAPLSPSTGYTLGGKLGWIQGVIVDLQSNVWAVDNENSQVAFFPNGDPAKATLLCVPGSGGCQVSKPFHLAVDGQNRIWIANAGNATVTVFPAGQPDQAQQFPLGAASNLNPKGMAIDSQGHAWVTNFVGSSVSHLLPSGASAPGSPYTGSGIKEPWSIAIDGNDHVWVAVFGGKALVELCGSRPETCPPGYQTGQPISPSEQGYVGAGLQHITDVAIDSAGNVWAANNWDDAEVCASASPQDPPAEAESTLCGGNGLVVFFGMAKPVATPLVGPPKAL